MRRSAADAVRGSIRLSFSWDVTARSLLNLKLAALERVLAQRTEVLVSQFLRHLFLRPANQPFYFLKPKKVVVSHKAATNIMGAFSSPLQNSNGENLPRRHEVKRGCKALMGGEKCTFSELSAESTVPCELWKHERREAMSIHNPTYPIMASHAHEGTKYPGCSPVLR